jgi:hypothetical protein
MFREQEFFISSESESMLHLDHHLFNKQEEEIQEFEYLTSVKGFGILKYDVKMFFVQNDGIRSPEIPQILLLSSNSISFVKEKEIYPSLTFPIESFSSISIRGIFLIIHFTPPSQQCLYIISNRSFELAHLLKESNKESFSIFSSSNYKQSFSHRIQQKNRSYEIDRQFKCGIESIRKNLKQTIKLVTTLTSGHFSPEKILQNLSLQSLLPSLKNSYNYLPSEDHKPLDKLIETCENLLNNSKANNNSDLLSFSILQDGSNSPITLDISSINIAKSSKSPQPFKITSCDISIPHEDNEDTLVNSLIFLEEEPLASIDLEDLTNTSIILKVESRRKPRRESKFSHNNHCSKDYGLTNESNSIRTKSPNSNQRYLPKNSKSPLPTVNNNDNNLFITTPKFNISHDTFSRSKNQMRNNIKFEEQHHHDKTPNYSNSHDQNINHSSIHHDKSSKMKAI